MSTNFAQRAKEIVAKNGSNKKAALAELDALRREQFQYEQSVNVDKEIERGTEIEHEHKPTLDFIKKYHKEKGKFPRIDTVAKSITVDHLEDSKKNPDMKNLDPNSPNESYYKSLIESGLADEVKQYVQGGFMHPMNVPDSVLEGIRNGYVAGGYMMSAGTPMDSTNRYATQETFADGGTIKTNMIRPVDIAGKAPTYRELEERHSSPGLSGRKEDVDAWIRYKQTLRAPAGGDPRTSRPATPERSFAQGGGLSRSEDYGSSDRPYPTVSKGDFAGGGRSYPIPTHADAVDALRLAGLHGRSDVKSKVYAKYPDLKHAFGGTVPVNTGGIYGAGLNVYAGNNPNGQALDLNARKPWDVLGRAGDWAGEKIGSAYENIVPEGARQKISSTAQFIGDLNRNPFTAFNPESAAREREYAAAHPVIGGVAPIPAGVGGAASKAIPMASRFERGAKTESAIEGVANRAYGVSKAGKVAAAEEAAIAQQAERSAKAKQLLADRAAGRTSATTATEQTATAGAAAPEAAAAGTAPGWTSTPGSYSHVSPTKDFFNKYGKYGIGVGALTGLGLSGLKLPGAADVPASGGPDAISGADGKTTFDIPAGVPIRKQVAAGGARGAQTAPQGFVPQGIESLRYTPGDASFTPMTMEQVNAGSSAPVAQVAPVAGAQAPVPESNRFDWQNAMRMAPIGFNALAGLLTKQGRGLPTNVNLQGITPQVIAPEQLSTAPIEQQIGQQYASGVNALSGAGNSAAAMRAGLSGMSLAGAQGGGAALNDIYARNAALRGDATKFNALSAGDAAKFNAQQSNMAKQINLGNLEKNQADKAATDKERYNRFAAAATGIGQVGKENWSKGMLSNLYGYDEQGKHISGDPKMALSKKQLANINKLGGYLRFK